MSNMSGKASCALMSWAMAVAVGALAFVLLLVLGDWRFMQAVFASGLIVAVLGLVFSFLFCRPLPQPVQMTAKPAVKPAAVEPPVTTAEPAPVAPAEPEVVVDAVTPVVEATPEPEPAPVPEPDATPEPAPEPEPEKPAAAPVIKPSAPLAGQAELASRKGNWTYTPESSAAEADGEKPELLDAPPEDGGDDLKQIKGIGPKMEKMCNDMGIYRFSQVASWSDAEVAWVDANLEGFKGRVSRDEWVAQAKLLAEGGETEFSKRVGDGGVY